MAARGVQGTGTGNGTATQRVLEVFLRTMQQLAWPQGLIVDWQHLASLYAYSCYLLCNAMQDE